MLHVEQYCDEKHVLMRLWIKENITALNIAVAGTVVAKWVSLALELKMAMILITEQATQNMISRFGLNCLSVVMPSYQKSVVV